MENMIWHWPEKSDISICQSKTKCTVCLHLYLCNGTGNTNKPIIKTNNLYL